MAEPSETQDKIIVDKRKTLEMTKELYAFCRKLEKKYHANNTELLLAFITMMHEGAIFHLAQQGAITISDE